MVSTPQHISCNCKITEEHQYSILQQRAFILPRDLRVPEELDVTLSPNVGPDITKKEKIEATLSTNLRLIQKERKKEDIQ